MCAIRWACAALAALALSGSVRAQSFQSAMTGVSPQSVTFRQVNLQNAIVGAPTPSRVGQSKFSLASFFRQVSPFGNAAPIIGSSNIPAPRYSNAYAPALPIMSTIQR